MSDDVKSLVPKPVTEPETIQERAARYGFVILESGEWVDAKAPTSKPRASIYRRFDLRYRPHHDPQGEWQRTVMLEAVEADAVKVFGWSTKTGERGPVVIPQLTPLAAPPSPPEAAPEAATAAPPAEVTRQEPPDEVEVELEEFEEPPASLVAEAAAPEATPAAPEPLAELHFEEHGGGQGVVEAAPGPGEAEAVAQGELAGPEVGVAHPEPASPEPERIEQEQAAEASAPKARKNAKRAQKVAADDSAPRKKAPREGNASARKVVEPSTLGLPGLFSED